MFRVVECVCSSWRLSSNILKDFELFNCAAMPLVRYEIRCEHSLANPELYRSAARDDPEGLLEGVAMAGLVGIVRQLGDLAEYVSFNPNYMGVM